MKYVFILLICATFAANSIAQKKEVNTAEYLLNSKKDYSAAQEKIDEAMKSPEAQAMPKAWVVKGNVYLHMGGEIYTKKYNPGDEEGKYNLGVQMINEAGEAYLKAKEMDDGKYTKDIETGLYNVTAKLYNTSNQLRTAEDSKASLECARSAAKFLPESKNGEEINELIQAAIGYAASDLGQSDAAIEGFSNFLELAGKKAGGANAEKINQMSLITISLISAYVAAGKFEEAYTLINDAKKKYTTDEQKSNISRTELNVYTKEDKLNERIPELEAMAKENPSEWTYFLLGSAYRKMDDFEKAVQAFSKSTEISPDFNYGTYNAGTVYYEDLGKGKNQEAEASSTPDNQRAALYKQRDEYFKKSIPFFEKIIAGYESGAIKTDGDEANYTMVEGSFKALRAIYGIMDNKEKRTEIIGKMKAKGFL